MIKSSGFRSVIIKFQNGVSIAISEASVPDPKVGTLGHGLPTGWRGIPTDESAPPIIYSPEEPSRDLKTLTIFENRNYEWEILSSKPTKVTSSFSSPPAGSYWNEKPERGSFRICNYLGTGWIAVKVGDSDRPDTIRLAVKSVKLDYDTEYSFMVKAVAERCSQLLLEFGSPVAFNMSANAQKSARTLLEQFLFIRHALGERKLDACFEAILRNPHNKLVREQTWKPFGIANPGAFLRNPIKYGRDWTKSNSAPTALKGRMPESVIEERKFESMDTDANRFIKFAIGQFREVCCEIAEATVGGKKLKDSKGTAWEEARELIESLDSFLAAPFFKEVSRMTRVPFESQTLQKREGYKEILHSWLMHSAATQIDWPGKDDFYDGNSKNAAVLYEYWLYFILVDMLKKNMGMEQIVETGDGGPDALPFFCKKEGKLHINLKEGSASFCRFNWKNKSGDALRIHFYYNKEFGGGKDAAKCGSYSRSFRPDYSLVILPSTLANLDRDKAEDEASKQGTIAYLHFDSKYRAERFEEIFRESNTASGEEKRDEKASISFKNADLYKMHTYNDAIRRTAGSYVLYPGDKILKKKSGGDDWENVFKRYHEILPGVGAFAVKPMTDGGAPAALAAIAKFVEEVFEHQVSRFTQHYRINYWTHDTIKETHKAPNYGEYPTVESLPAKDAKVLLGYIRPVAEEVVKTSGYFYAHAVEADGKTPNDFDLLCFSEGWFLGYSDSGMSLPWYGRISRRELMRRDELAAKLGDGSVLKSTATHYFVFTIDKASVRPITPINLVGIKKEKAKPVLTSWDRIAKLK